MIPVLKPHIMCLMDNVQLWCESTHWQQHRYMAVIYVNTAAYATTGCFVVQWERMYINLYLIEVVWRLHIWASLKNPEQGSIWLSTLCVTDRDPQDSSEPDPAPVHAASGGRPLLRAGWPHSHAGLWCEAPLLPTRPGTNRGRTAKRRPTCPCATRACVWGLLPGAAATFTWRLEAEVLHRLWR